jgi:hypothetical protein
LILGSPLEAQAERILRAVENCYFKILDRAIGRPLLKRPGHEIAVERVLTLSLTIHFQKGERIVLS